MPETDIAIVGCGATGALMAAKLAASGRRVVVLEAGPERKLETLYSSTIWSRRLKWGGPPVECVGGNPTPYPFEAGWGTGGAALHHYACWFRLHEQDFRTRTLLGRARDWPFEYRDLQPFYDEVQALAGISGDQTAEVWRPPGAPYPMPPLPVFRQGEVIGEGFRRLGMRVAPLPMAINSEPYKGRPACINDGWCDAGCPIGALANPITLFGKALAGPNVEVRHRCAATRILTEGGGRRATGVEYVDAVGKRRTLSAAVIVVSAFTVESVRLLLNSATSAHPAGLANRSGQVGRSFLAHGAVNLFGMFPEAMDPHLGRTGGQLVSQDRYDRAADHYGRACTWRIGPALKLADLGGIANSRPELAGAALGGFLDDASRRLGSISALVESDPSPENRIELANRRDEHGSRQARVRHTLGPDTLKALDKAKAEGLEALRAAGAREVWAAAIRTEHMMGGLAMGERPESSVVNGYGQSHEVENLFASGPALFPTAGAVNPTYTASALAARTAGYIAREWRAFV